MKDRIRRFERFAWVVLGYAIVVIVWGAVVRATGSGAGCGNHWPLCNGAVVPLAPSVATIIEFGHRASVGGLNVLSLLLAWSAVRVFPKGHGARRAALLSLAFVIAEDAIGAGIVLLKLVEHNASLLRACYVGAHLVNTQLLVAASTAAVWCARAETTPARVAPDVRVARLLLYGLLAMLLVGASGAVVALGDTLFPQSSLAAGLAADFSATSHFLIRLRIWHPVLAATAGLYAMTVLWRIGGERLPASARWAIGLLCGQWALGILNLVMFAPLALQMAHLLVANVLWVVLVLVWLDLRRDVERVVEGQRAEGRGQRAKGKGRSEFRGRRAEGKRQREVRGPRTKVRTSTRPAPFPFVL